MLVKRVLSGWAVLSLLMPALPAAPVGAQVAELTVTSAAFADGDAILLRNSAYGEDLSPGIAGLAREAVMSAIEGHLLGEGRVTGIFERER